MQSESHLQEYLTGNSGYYGTWTYDLKSSKIAKMTNEWLNELPHNKRDTRSIIRHLMSKISSENSDNALMVGKWTGSYTEDGRPPTHWINSSSIFEHRIKTGKPVKYGQCWCFAECMTSMMRYLKIPCRTVCGRNIMIDENLDNGVDFKQELRKDESSSNMLAHLNRDYMNEMFKNLVSSSSSYHAIEDGADIKDGTNVEGGKEEESGGREREGGGGTKSEWDNLKIYDCGDSTWNVHFWNEVWIDGHWEAIDTTPVLESEVIEDSKNKKILGPSTLLVKDANSVDFKRFHAMVNSPFRLWATETISVDDKLIDIPYVYSVIFPHSKKKSRYLKLPKIIELFSKGPTVYIKHDHHDVNITDRYRASDRVLEDMYMSSFNSKLGNMMYLQTVYLDYSGNVIKVDRFKGSFENYRHRRVEPVPECYLTSCLAVEISDKNSGDKENGEESEVSRTPNFIAFCSYYS